MAKQKRVKANEQEVAAKKTGDVSVKAPAVFDEKYISKKKAIKYMRLAQFLAQEFSKDESTKVGALLLHRKDYAILATGYNGMPRKAKDDKPERLLRPEKYLWFEHAERNAIYNAAKHGTRLNKCIAIVTLMPCMDCMRGLASVGAKCVVGILPPKDSELRQRWDSHFDRSVELAAELKIKLCMLEPEELLA